MTLPRPLFILIGQERIKLSNIKHYEVHEYTYEEEVKAINYLQARRRTSD